LLLNAAGAVVEIHPVPKPAFAAEGCRFDALLGEHTAIGLDDTL
jgi:hypothetical protein